MVAFGLDVVKPCAIKKILEVRTNLLIDNFVKNPFQGKIIAFGKDFFVVVMDPVYPPVHLFSIFPWLFAVIFWGHWVGTVSTVIALIMSGTAIFWWDKFYFLLFYFTTKRGVRYVSADEALKRVI